MCIWAIGARVGGAGAGYVGCTGGPGIRAISVVGTRGAAGGVRVAVQGSQIGWQGVWDLL